MNIYFKSNNKVILFIAVFLFLMIRSVSAADCGGGTPCNCGDTLTSSYAMTSDLTGCTGDGIIIGANNIILDCQGHGIVGSKISNTHGILLNGISGVTIKNCIITNFYYGIGLVSSPNNTIINNTANSNTHYGIDSYSSPNNTIRANNLTSNNVGIYLRSSSSNTTLANNTANSNQYGIILGGSNNNILKSNTANSNIYGIWLSSSSSNTIQLNNLTNDSIGIYSDSSNSTILQNYACENTNLDLNSSNWLSSSGDNNTCDRPDGWNDNGKTGCAYYCIKLIHCGDTINSSYNMTSDLTNSTGGNICPGDGIDIGANNITLDCQGHKLTGNRIGYTAGINLTGISGTTIKNCIITNFTNGIYLEYSSDNNTVTSNTANSNQYGINLGGANNNILTNNTANYNLDGIFLSTSDSNNILTNNTANSNQQYGIWLAYSSNNIVTNNTANSNQFGIYFDTFSTDNTVTRNTANSNKQSGIYFGWYSNNIVTNNTANSNYVGIYSDSSNLTINTNYACGNTNLDFDSFHWYSSSGDNNTCDKPDGWNDTFKIGCTYQCTITCPTITILSPVNNTEYYKANVLLNFTINEPTSWIGYSLNNKPNITITGPANMTNSTGYFVNGNNSVIVYASATSCTGASNKVYFNYCKGDVNGDGKVNVLDLINIVGKLNAKCGDANYNASFDLNNDCAINVLDLIVVSSNLNAVCTPTSLCTDGIRNGQETDVDCGGGTCPACQLGKNCNINSDCTSNKCTNGKCTT